MTDILLKELAYGNDRLQFFGHPDKCPECHKVITPNWAANTYTGLTETIYALLVCPASDCKSGFCAEYLRDQRGRFNYSKIMIGTPSKYIHSKEVVGISPQFSNIFGQAYIAEQMGLTEVSGIGYRKALEFLVKDYLKARNPGEDVEIEKAFLGACIKKIAAPHLQIVAERAVWLGNDESHYVKKWSNQTLTDLRVLIELTATYVQTEEMTNHYLATMPAA